ncbi:hypothetical protein CEXT_12571 [Caerostris extrusa]|uniref:Uncharacterized protein n=1 Tax=Caerostris extrusa TaxID=172846 RepID=A0AAV4P9L6_CAEEX|nr:hypothetical protein CEXT_12571 [Caerostris extrusa]
MCSFKWFEVKFGKLHTRPRYHSKKEHEYAWLHTESRLLALTISVILQNSQFFEKIPEWSTYREGFIQRGFHVVFGRRSKGESAPLHRPLTPNRNSASVFPKPVFLSAQGPTVAAAFIFLLITSCRTSLLTLQQGRRFPRHALSPKRLVCTTAWKLRQQENKKKERNHLAVGRDRSGPVRIICWWTN